jgi:hypothetical protein
MCRKLFVRPDVGASNGRLTVTGAIGELMRYRGRMSTLDQRVLHLYVFEYTSVDIRS